MQKLNLSQYEDLELRLSRRYMYPSRVTYQLITVSFPSPPSPPGPLPRAAVRAGLRVRPTARALVLPRGAGARDRRLAARALPRQAAAARGGRAQQEVRTWDVGNEASDQIGADFAT